MNDTAKINTAAGTVTAERLSAAEIVGTSPWGDWSALLGLNTRTSYRYPDYDDAHQAAVRRVVAKLVANKPRRTYPEGA